MTAPDLKAEGFTAIVCGMPRAKKCHYCTRQSEVLCDHPAGIGKTCDRPCCKTHAEHVGADRDYCITHAEFERKKKAEADAAAREMEDQGLWPCNECGSPVSVRNDFCEQCYGKQASEEAWEIMHPESRCPPRE